MRRGWIAALLVAAAVSSATGAQAAEKLRIGVLRLASSGPVFVAEDKGYFAAEGLEVELRFFDAAQPVALATVSGDIDIGVTGLTAGFFNLAGKTALRIVAAQSREEPGYHLNAYIVTKQAWEAGLKSLGDLPGHSVAITQTGSTFHYSLGLLADKLHFQLASLRLVPVQSLGNMASALKGGQVDAAVMPATAAQPLIDAGDVKVIGWVGDETPWQLGAIFTMQATIDGRRAVVAAAVRAYRRGARDFYDAFLKKGSDGKPAPGPEAPAILAIVSKYTGLPAERIAAGIPYVDPDARLLVRDVYNQVAWYQAQGLVDKDVDAKSILDLTFVEGHLDLPK
ncbi:MAG TPA: ABC transporter substrate-binding protein [Stellaceae bacterium]|nr:ABC transporter substrate-binding protein [Stellaceae bacterium]